LDAAYPGELCRKDVEVFGSDVPMERPGQPAEVAPSYLYLSQRRFFLCHGTDDSCQRRNIIVKRIIKSQSLEGLAYSLFLSAAYSFESVRNASLSFSSKASLIWSCQHGKPTFIQGFIKHHLNVNIRHCDIEFFCFLGVAGLHELSVRFFLFHKESPDAFFIVYGLTAEKKSIRIYNF
jgi:hypothetical protein